MTQCLPTIASTSPSLTVDAGERRLGPRRGQDRPRPTSATAATGSVQAILPNGIAGIVAVEEMPDRAADDDDQRDHQPGLAGGR